MFFNKVLCALLLGSLWLGSATAAPSYCYSGPADPAPTVTDDGGGNLSDVTLGGVAADNCSGVWAGNPNAAAISTLWGAGWALAAKDNVGASDDESHVVNGLKWVASAASDSDFYSGTFTLAVTDTNGSAPGNLGDIFDLVFVDKAGNAYVTYFFGDVSVSSLMSGTWEVNYLNPISGQRSELSNFSAYVRFVEGGPPNDVPEPSSLALASLALAGIVLTNRRRRPKATQRA